MPALAALLLALAPLGSPSADVHPDIERRLAEVGAPVKVWVFFEDKGFADARAEEEALDALAAALPERQRARREARRSAAGLVDARDLPLFDPYVDAVRAAGAAVEVESPWLNAASALVDGDAVQEIARLPFVRELRLVARSAPLAPLAPRAACAVDGTFYGIAQAQIELMGLDELHALGFTGAGVRIAVLDTGFRLTHAAFQDPAHPLTVVAQKDFVHDDDDVTPEDGDDPSEPGHGTVILGTLAAYLPDSLVGAAYDAEYVLCKTEDVTQEVQGEEDDYVAGLQFAEAQGADVATSSLGYIDWYTQADLDGASAVTTIAVNIATQNGLFCCTAAGNASHDDDPLTSTLIAPADALEVLSCGAVLSDGTIAGFSSSGPTADGRVKPEVLAVGVDTGTVYPYDDSTLATSAGTSLSTPLLAGAVACLAQAHPTWDVARMRHRVIAGADAQGLSSPDPLHVRGYGIVDAPAAHDGLLLGPPDPGVAGQTSDVLVSGAVAGNPVLLGWALTTGTIPLPACAGEVADLGPLALLQVAPASADGDASFSTPIPASAVGLTVLAQAVDLLACAVSGLRQVEIQ